MFSLDPDTSRQHPEMTVDQAKQSLRQWGVEADESLRIQIENLVSATKKTTQGVLPWAAGGALLLGWLSGRGKRKGDSGSSSRPGMIRTILGLAMDIAPLAASFLSRRRD